KTISQKFSIRDLIAKVLPDKLKQLVGEMDILSDDFQEAVIISWLQEKVGSQNLLPNTLAGLLVDIQSYSEADQWKIVDLLKEIKETDISDGIKAVIDDVENRLGGVEDQFGGEVVDETGVVERVVEQIDFRLIREGAVTVERPNGDKYPKITNIPDSYNPTVSLSVNNVTYYISPVHKFSDQYEMAVGYIELNGVIYTRPFIRSTSQGIWRSYSHNGENNWFGEGYDEQLLTLPLEVNNKLNQLASAEVIQRGDEEAVFWGLLESGPGIRGVQMTSGSEQYQYSREHLEPKQLPGKFTIWKAHIYLTTKKANFDDENANESFDHVVSLDWNQSTPPTMRDFADQYAWLGGLNNFKYSTATSTKYEPLLYPDPGSWKWNETSEGQGKEIDLSTIEKQPGIAKCVGVNCTAEIYSFLSKDKTVRYLILQDLRTGKIWSGGWEDLTQPITSFGLRKQGYVNRWYGTSLYEYIIQIPREYWSKQSDDLKYTRYGSMALFVSELPDIKAAHEAIEKYVQVEHVGFESARMLEVTDIVAPVDLVKSMGLIKTLRFAVFVKLSAWEEMAGILTETKLSLLADDQLIQGVKTKYSNNRKGFLEDQGLKNQVKEIFEQKLSWSVVTEKDYGVSEKEYEILLTQLTEMVFDEVSEESGGVEDQSGGEVADEQAYRDRVIKWTETSGALRLATGAIPSLSAVLGIRRLWKLNQRADLINFALEGLGIKRDLTGLQEGVGTDQYEFLEGVVDSVVGDEGVITLFNRFGDISVTRDKVLTTIRIALAEKYPGESFEQDLVDSLVDRVLERLDEGKAVEDIAEIRSRIPKSEDRPLLPSGTIVDTAISVALPAIGLVAPFMNALEFVQQTLIDRFLADREQARLEVEGLEKAKGEELTGFDLLPNQSLTIKASQFFDGIKPEADFEVTIKHLDQPVETDRTLTGETQSTQWVISSNLEQIKDIDQKIEVIKPNNQELEEFMKAVVEVGVESSAELNEFRLADHNINAIINKYRDDPEQMDILAVKRDGELAGIMLIRRSSEDLARVELLVTLPKYWNQGLASVLLNKVKQDYVRVVLNALDYSVGSSGNREREEALNAFYRSHGFVNKARYSQRDINFDNQYERLETEEPFMEITNIVMADKEISGGELLAKLIPILKQRVDNLEGVVDSVVGDEGVITLFNRFGDISVT
ncbi:GNAT family N-acetyltransferase, partial [Patescibacteria group bacterium]|nr:GNAT family N-acetyltransferase [Patescibacteria group bacterium]